MPQDVEFAWEASGASDADSGERTPKMPETNDAKTQIRETVGANDTENESQDSGTGTPSNNRRWVKCLAAIIIVVVVAAVAVVAVFFIRNKRADRQYDEDVRDSIDMEEAYVDQPDTDETEETEETVETIDTEESEEAEETEETEEAEETGETEEMDDAGDSTAGEEVMVYEAPSRESVEELMYMMDMWMVGELEDWYAGYGEGILDFEEIGAQEAYQMAAWAYLNQGYPDSDFSVYYYVDGEMLPVDSVSESQIPDDERLYVQFPREVYQEYLTDMFGSGYDVSDYVPRDGYDDSYWLVRTDDGEFYEVLGEFGDEWVEVSVENISDEPDEDGVYTARIEYDHYAGDDDAEIVEFDCRLKPDADSAYGCVIVGISPI